MEVAAVVGTFTSQPLGTKVVVVVEEDVEEEDVEVDDEEDVEVEDVEDEDEDEDDVEVDDEEDEDVEDEVEVVFGSCSITPPANSAFAFAASAAATSAA